MNTVDMLEIILKFKFKNKIDFLPAVNMYRFFSLLFLFKYWV